MVKFRDSTKFVFMLFVCMLLTVSISFAVCFTAQNKTKSNKTDVLQPIQNTIEINQIEYTNQNIPNGFASQETIAKSLNSSVSVSVTTSDGNSFGSGTIVGADSTNSYVVTCHHVIEDAKLNSIMLTFSDGTKKQASFVGSDPKTDVAVLKVEDTTHPVCNTILNNDQIFAGENVYVIGNALGVYDFSVSTGCISQKAERQVTIPNFGTFDVLQTDAPINHGVSGGGMFDSHGTLVGMISCGYDGDAIQNVNFVLPIYKVMEIVSALLTNTDSVSGFGFVPDRISIDLMIATWGESPSYAIVTDVPKTSSFYGTNKDTSLFKFDLLKSVQIGDDIIQIITSAPALAGIIQEAKDNDKLHVGTQIKFVACENSGINNIERNVVITLKQYVYVLN